MLYIFLQLQEFSILLNNMLNDLLNYFSTFLRLNISICFVNYTSLTSNGIARLDLGSDLAPSRLYIVQS